LSKEAKQNWEESNWKKCLQECFREWIWGWKAERKIFKIDWINSIENVYGFVVEKLESSSDACYEKNFNFEISNEFKGKSEHIVKNYSVTFKS
jgi:hypothetical protein